MTEQLHETEVTEASVKSCVDYWNTHPFKWFLWCTDIAYRLDVNVFDMLEMLRATFSGLMEAFVLFCYASARLIILPFALLPKLVLIGFRRGLACFNSDMDKVQQYILEAQRQKPVPARKDAQ